MRLAAAASPRRRHRHPPFKLKQIARGVYAYGGVNQPMTPENRGAIANLGLVVGDSAAAVIDSGGSLAEAHAFRQAIAEVTDRPLRYLIATHMHPDHIFGNALFRDEGAAVVGHHNLPAALEARGAFYLQSYRRQLGTSLMQGIEIVPPTVLVTDRLSLDLGGRTLELEAWQAAHTDNDLTVFEPASRTLFTGDLAFISICRHSTARCSAGSASSIGSVPSTRPRVVPGHGPVPSPWPQALAAERRYFEVWPPTSRGDRGRRAARRGRRDRRPIGAAQLGLFDDYNERNATAAYAELEWE